MPVMIIIAISFAVYFNAIFNGFVYDDVFQVTENEWITSVSHIPEIFTKSVWGFQPWTSSSNYYRPMMHLIYMLNYHLFGLKPWGFHLVNIFFHAGVSVLVFLFVSRLLSESYPSPSNEDLVKTKAKGKSFSTSTSTSSSAPHSQFGKGETEGAAVISLFTFHDARSLAFIAALLFAVHPIHTEAVTWVAGLPEVSFTFFSLLSFYLYIRAGAGFTRDYLFSVVFFSLAILCKETALTMLLIFIAYDYRFRKNGTGLAVNLRRYIPYFLVTVVYLLLRYNALGGFAPEKKHAYLSTSQYVINVFPLFSQYLLKLILPITLNAFYVLHPVYSVFEMKEVLSVGVTGVIIACMVVAFKRNRLVFFGLLLFVLPLLPVLYIPVLGENSFTERYLYLPSVGFAVIAAQLLIWIKANVPKAFPVFTAALLVIGGLYSVGTVTRNAVWKDDLALYTDTARKSPDAFIPNNNLGFALMKEGRMDEAKERLKTALRLKPGMIDLIINRSISYMERGFIDKAVLELNNALFLDPGRVDAHYYLGAAYARKGWLSQAVEEFMITLSMRPDYPNVHNDLAGVYAAQGRFDKAMSEYESELKVNPADARAHNNLGVLYLQQDNPDKAIGHFRSAVKLNPADATFQKNLDRAQGMKGEGQKGRQTVK